MKVGVFTTHWASRFRNARGHLWSLTRCRLTRQALYSVNKQDISCFASESTTICPGDSIRVLNEVFLIFGPAIKLHKVLERLAKCLTLATTPTVIFRSVATRLGQQLYAGFVSYARPQHAEAAIGRMNGFFVGNKRLKVVRKRGQQLDRCCSDNSTGNKTCSTSPSPRRPTSSSYCTPVGASLRTMIRRGDEKKVNGKADTELTGRRADSGDVTDEQGEPFCDSLRLNLDFLAHDGVHGQSSRR